MASNWDIYVIMGSFINKCFIILIVFFVKLLELLCVEEILSLFTKAEPSLCPHHVNPCQEAEQICNHSLAGQTCRPKQFVLVFLNRGPTKAGFLKWSSAYTCSQAKPQSCLERCQLAQNKNTTGKSQTLP